MFTFMPVAAFAEDDGINTESELYDAIANGGEVALSGTITVNERMTVPDGTVIDLQNNTLYINVENSYYNNVTIKNGNLVIGKDDVHVCDGYFLVNPTKTLTLQNVNLTSSEDGFKGYAVFHLKDSAKLIIENGSAINVANNEYAGSVIYAGDTSSVVTVSNSAITGENVGRGVVYTTIDIINSQVTFKGTTENGLEHGFNGANLTVTDSNINIWGGSGRGITLGRTATTDMAVNGSSTIDIRDMVEATIKLSQATDKITIASTSTVTVDKAPIIVDGCFITGDIIVDLGDAAVAKVGNSDYATLDSAINAAGVGDTVTLLKNVEGSGIVIDKNITINLGGNTYTVTNPTVGSAGTETLGFQLLKGNNITLKNGTVATNTDSAKMLIQNYSNLTLENITLDGTGSANMGYVLSNNNGATVIKGATNIVAPTGKVAFDVYYWPKGSYGDVSVTFDETMTGTVTGGIEFGFDNTTTSAAAAEHAKIEIKAGTFTATPSAYVVTGSCVSKTSPYVVSTTHTAGAPVEENRVEASYSAPGSYDSVVYCSVCDAEISRETKAIPQLEIPYVPPVSGGGSSTSTSTPKVETETTVTPSGTKVETTTETKSDGTKVETTTTTTASGETTKVETTTETNKEGTKVETTVTTDAKGETSTTVTATLDNGSAVTNNDKAVEVEVTKVEEKVVETVQKAVKADETVNVVGDADNAVSVSATNASTGAAQTDFVQPMSVNVPVDTTVLNNVEDTSKLTLAKVVTNEDGTTELVYMGGSYDEETGTFNAKVDEDGDYILVEKADLVKIELTIDDTTVKHNDKHHELDVAPAINAEAGRTELPLRYLGEALGFGIDWNNNVVTITKDGVSFSLTIGVEIPGYGTPYIDSDRTMVSARYISEMLGANVIWDPVDRQVIVVK